MDTFFKSNDLEVQESSRLSHLLPYDPNAKRGKRLKDGLQEFLLLLTAAEEAVDSLHRDRLEFFDPLVGENACQIRALKLALILREPSLQLLKLLDAIHSSKRKVEQLLASNRVLCNQSSSLQELMNEERIDIEITDNDRFLIKSYLLSKVKTERAPKPEYPLIKNEYTDTKKIKDMGKVGTMFAENLIKSLREKVSNASVKFVQKVATLLPVLDTRIDMVSDKYLVKHRGLDCIPCYWMTKILMQKALLKRIPMIMIVEQIAKDQNYRIMNKMTLFFEATPSGYVETSSCSLPPEMPALVLLGRSCRASSEFPPEDAAWKQELLAHNPIDLVLAYAAAHRQYPDESKDLLVSESEDESYRFYKAKSQEWGCSILNPFLFFLAHAYCDKIKNIKMN